MIDRVLPVLATLLLAVPAARAQPRPPNVQPWAWEQAGAAGRVEVLVLLSERADAEAARRTGDGDRLSRRRAVVAALRETAGRGQAGLLRRLAARGVPARPFWIANAVLVEADRALLAELAARPDVARVVGNPRVRGVAPEVGDPEPPPKAAVPWGVTRLGAPELWALGHDGTGVVVGGQDTGVRWTHEALRDHYRGWDGAAATHELSWHDAIHDSPDNPCGADAAEPCDDSGHGTHTLATAAGGSAEEAVGVAPGARWIACRNMDQGWGSPSTYLECFEWLLAPWAPGADPATGDPALGADVTVNSWACPPEEGCDRDVLEGALEAHRAAGIFPSVSAGNSGPACGSIAHPPAVHDASVTVGATDAGDGVAAFSSRGPAAGTALPKPDLVAPGVGVRSATRDADDSYGDGTGTSMASPHLAGAVALLWSALPALRGDVDATETLLARTAQRLSSVQQGCGGDEAFGPNDTWGAGRIDVARALASFGGPTAEIACGDGVDEDGDGLADCADPECAGDPACPEAGHCADFVDNDRDGDSDCRDAECLGDAECPEAAHCADGLDNDQDGAVDCDDRQCDASSACPVLAASVVIPYSTVGLAQPLADAFDAACRVPKWRPCPDVLFPGPLPLRLPGEGSRTGAQHLRLYEHSDGRADVRVSRDGDDLVASAP